MTSPNFWDNQSEAQKVIDEMKHLKEQIEAMTALEEKHEEFQLMYELLAEEGEDPALVEELTKGLRTLAKEVDDFELSLMLNEPYDRNSAILELHPGAGGTE